MSEQKLIENKLRKSVYQSFCKDDIVNHWGDLLIFQAVKKPP